MSTTGIVTEYYLGRVYGMVVNLDSIRGKPDDMILFISWRHASWVISASCLEKGGDE
jgi:hypothetical protein